MRIVYAEDDAVVRANVAMLLVKFGVDVHEARDGGEALALCRAASDKKCKPAHKVHHYFSPSTWAGLDFAMRLISAWLKPLAFRA